MAEEDEVAVVAPADVAEEETKSPDTTTTTDLKRKLSDLQTEEAEAQSSPQRDLTRDELKSDPSSTEVSNPVPDAKKPRLEKEVDELENGHEVEKSDVPAENEGVTKTDNVDVEDAENGNSGDVKAENPQITSAAGVDADQAAGVGADDVKHVTSESTQMETSEIQSVDVPQGGDAPKTSNETLKTEDAQHPEEDLQQPVLETQAATRKMEVPSNKVGVLIGKAGDTIRLLQLNSGAKIQITRDAEADPYSATRPVELVGTLENINKAEKLIKDVIAEADAGGSPSLVARGFGAVQARGAAEQIQIQVPNEKVRFIIGKGGETIKSLQTRSGARIQLIPQHLPEGDQSKERTVQVTGDKKQIEVARGMIKEVMNQPLKPSPLSGGYNQQAYRPRGPSGQSQWGAHAPHTAQGTGYDSRQRGMHQSQNSQYMAPAHGGYRPQQTTPRSNFNAGWNQRPGPVHTPPPQSGYDYYAHGHAPDSSVHTPMPNSGPIPASTHGAPPTHMNYNNYGQPQGPDYWQPTYSQPAPSQQNYGHGYDDQKYANQVPTQSAYGGHGNAQPGAYPQQGANQSSYAQQPYSKPPYGMPSQGPTPQSYGPPRVGQSGDVPYQNPAYGQTVPSQQPYASGGPTPQSYPYNSAPPANGYNQPPAHSAPAPVHPQTGGQAVPGYGQPGGQAAPGYSQGGQSGGYGPYPSQPGYGEQPVVNNAGYGYQGADAGYGSAPTAYGAPPNVQTNYMQQPISNQPSYEQPAPQSGAYASVPGSAPGTVPTQMYGGQQ